VPPLNSHCLVNMTVVYAKGKGELQTYWLDIGANAGSSTGRDSSSDAGSEIVTELMADEMPGLTSSPHNAKTLRLIDWNVDVLVRLLKQIVAHRSCVKWQPKGSRATIESRFLTGERSMPLDEVQEIIVLPNFEASIGPNRDVESIVLEAAVIEQVRDYVSNVATMYRANPFHNFEHVSDLRVPVHLKTVLRQNLTLTHSCYCLLLDRHRT
jgi:hypothetical protein